MHTNAARDRHLAAGTTGSRLSLDNGHGGTHITLLKKLVIIIISVCARVHVCMCLHHGKGGGQLMTSESGPLLPPWLPQIKLNSSTRLM